MTGHRLVFLAVESRKRYGALVSVAGATLPVAAFFLLAVYGRNPLLGAAVIVLGIGHIGIHWMHRKELTVN
ncbi:MAG: hypothetical protein HFH93_07255 [Lachnospiraceae bacterium]|nr:hypothetical protein [Lachnospiraceae bacterium]